MNLNYLNKLLVWLPKLLAQGKAGNNSNKLKAKSDKYYIFRISIRKSQKHFKTI